ncbi:MAG: hypothetical protein KC416_13705, partial [Myxococcales bacterium]|nr:hypothetical protein [Myxococcales bacterium]
MFRPLVLSAFLLSALSVGSIAEAQKKGQAKVSSGNAAALHSALGDLKWGMTKKEVLDHFTKAIREKYRKPLAKAPDAIEADRLRHEMNEAIRKIHESVTSFDGETTGWDVSFLKGEFTHHNGEEMLVVRDENSQNFYFFIDGKLWKWYKAFDAKVFA